ncbi:hypothetical protein SEA_BIG4_310 [Microbacterium phage Big4]|nr:hypothetical protein SEA_BIG4_310 [Microbacterium phage Big4]
MVAMTEEQKAALAMVGLTPESVEKFTEKQKVRGKRDARVCVCGHAGGAHFARDLTQTPIDSLGEGEVSCQAGKTPCECNTFKWVLTIEDVRSFIQKTEGPGADHALSKGLASSARRGFFPEWREGIRCFYCKRPPEEAGTLYPVAYNERGGEAFRSTSVNLLHCMDCRATIQAQVSGVKTGE